MAPQKATRREAATPVATAVRPQVGSAAASGSPRPGAGIRKPASGSPHPESSGDPSPPGGRAIH
ncbi:hypothetical protein [Herbiconiux daphne]|uniref:Uncharacterized protein n=1 Tax=Herbiconiux daphne TaxID=2970914 RepID=A0ABT2H5Q7_9MICO|nr:hypothetical protein [Herbiconiux daphne]MCS5735272.1 hypothetical protein [Herbiconiux daphne]